MSAPQLVDNPVTAMRYYLENVWGIKQWEWVPAPEGQFPTLAGVNFKKDGEIYFAKYNYEKKSFEKPQIAI